MLRLPALTAPRLVLLPSVTAMFPPVMDRLPKLLVPSFSVMLFTPALSVTSALPRAQPADCVMAVVSVMLTCVGEPSMAMLPRLFEALSSWIAPLDLRFRFPDCTRLPPV